MCTIVCATPANLAQVYHEKGHLLRFDDGCLEILAEDLLEELVVNLLVAAHWITRSLSSDLSLRATYGVGLRSWKCTANFPWFASVEAWVCLRDCGLQFCPCQVLRKMKVMLWMLSEIPPTSYRADYQIIPDWRTWSCQRLWTWQKNWELRKEVLDLANLVAHEKFVNYVGHCDISEKIDGVSHTVYCSLANGTKTEAALRKENLGSLDSGPTARALARTCLAQKHWQLDVVLHYESLAARCPTSQQGLENHDCLLDSSVLTQLLC